MTMDEKQRERRERIATAVLGAFLTDYAKSTWTLDAAAQAAVEAAEALIYQLDKEPSR